MDGRKHQDCREHDLGVFRAVVPGGPREEHAAHQCEQETQVDERPPATDGNHEQREHAGRGIVAIHDLRARIVQRKRRRKKRTQHREETQRQRAARYCIHSRAQCGQCQQGNTRGVVQVAEKGEGTVRREVGDAKRSASEGKGHCAPGFALPGQRRGQAKHARCRDSGAQLDGRSEIEIDEGVAQQRPDAHHQQSPADLGRPVAAR